MPLLNGLSAAGVLEDDDLIIVEESLGCDLEPELDRRLEIVREKKYKNQKHIFIKKKPEETGL